MELKIERIIETTRDENNKEKIQPVLTVTLKADEEEKKVFVDLELDKLSNSDELLQKYFSHHKDLYSALGIPSKYWDNMHSGDNQFSGTCEGFARFLSKLNDVMLDRISEIVLGKIREQMEKTHGTLTSIRTIMLSPTKTLPTVTFPVEDPEIFKLQIGNKIYAIQPNLIEEESSLIDVAKSTIKGKLDEYQKFYQDSSNTLLLQVEEQYKQEIQRVREQYSNKSLFPEWLTQEGVRQNKIVTFCNQSGQVSYVIPFRFNMIQMQYRNEVHVLKDRYQEHASCLVQLIIQNEKLVWMKLINSDFHTYPNPHTMDGGVCSGSYRLPEKEIRSINQLLEIRDDIQNLFRTYNLDSIGDTSNFSDNQSTLLSMREGGTIRSAFTGEKAHVHSAVRMDEDV